MSNKLAEQVADMPDQSDVSEDNQCSCEKLSALKAELERLTKENDKLKLEVWGGEMSEVQRLTAELAEADATHMRLEQSYGRLSAALAAWRKGHTEYRIACVEGRAHD